MLAYVHDKNKLILKDMPKPKASSNSAVVKVEATSVCGTDLRTYLHGNEKLAQNRIIGHEFCGKIAELGENIKNFKVGDRITVAPAIGCGKCHMCKKKKFNMCENLETIGWQYNGCFAEYIEIPYHAFEMDNVILIKDGITPEEASLIEPIACVVNSHSYLKIGKEDIVAIFGSGFIGCMHAEFALASEAKKAVMIEFSQRRIEEVKSFFNSIEIINPLQENLKEKIDELTLEQGVDVAITACSSGKAQVDAQDISAKCARISLFGGIPGESKGFIDSNKVHYMELSIYGVHASTPEQNRLVLDYIINKRIDVKKYISNIYALKDIEQALADLKEQKVIKAIIKP